MSTEISTNMRKHLANEFWGGDDNGVCLQITSKEKPQYIQLTMEEAAELHKTLGVYIKNEALRRQALLKEELELLKTKEKTVFDEVLNLSSDYFSTPELAILMVSKFCPKVRKREVSG